VLILGIVPFCEELFFRGFLYGGLRRRLPFPVAAVISAVVFGAVHLNEANVYERTGSLWSTIAIHVTNNAIVFTYLVTT
jgi:membrane protease YdiL (CAAX protease family)